MIKSQVALLDSTTLSSRNKVQKLKMCPSTLLGLEYTLFSCVLQPFIKVVDKEQENFSNITLQI
jgi:hypothetical protein